MHHWKFQYNKGTVIMEVKKEIICISCPVGCHLTVTGTTGQEIRVTGNQCPRGEVYGREEFLAPTRIVTAVVKTNSIKYPYVPVKTDRPLLRAYIPGLLKQLYSLEVPVPVKSGDIVVENYCGTHVNAVFTRSIYE
jgi:CxxC motif-containing protein